VGLGHRFLRHVERTRLLLHLVTLHDEPGRTPLEDYEIIRRELERYSPELAERKEIVAMSKADLPDVREAYEEAKAAFAERGVELRLVSAASHYGLDSLVSTLRETLSTLPVPQVATAPAAPTRTRSADEPTYTDEGEETLEGEDGDESDVDEDGDAAP
jgi:GTP-binding protein